MGVLKIDDTISDSDNVNVILPPKFQVKESPTQKVVSDSIDSAEGSQEKKPGVKKAVARAKVPFEKGYSQMDWLKLTRTHPDLAGLKGHSQIEGYSSRAKRAQSNGRFISMDEVRQQKIDDSIWTVLKGCVYHISPYMKFHPGGEVYENVIRRHNSNSTSCWDGVLELLLKKRAWRFNILPESVSNCWDWASCLEQPFGG